MFSHLVYKTLKTTLNDIQKNNNTVELTEEIIKLNEVVFSANKQTEKKRDLPTRIEIIDAKDISFNNPQSTGEMLFQTGKVFVQQSQMGGSSPSLRGFEANKILLVVDGVRMNNAIYRGGHLQNVITLDPNVLDRTEIVFGPGSVIYGSDALGGVMHFYTKKPEFGTDEKTNIKSTAFARYSSSNEEKTGGATINIGLNNIASFSSISYKDLGDLKSGQVRDPFIGNFGQCLYYAERFGNKDSMVKNDKSYLQKNSGYSQYDLMQKLYFKITNKSFIGLNLQYSNSSDIPRYDRLTDFDSKKGTLKYAEWYYGPQTRLFSSLFFENNSKTLFSDNLVITTAYQNISEDRVNRKFNNVNKAHNEETVDVFSFNTDIKKELKGKHELRYGIEATYNKVKSTAYNENIVTGVQTNTIATRYPDGDNNVKSLSAYISHNWEINKYLILSDGIRYNYYNLEANYTDFMMNLMKFPFNSKISTEQNSITANLGVVINPGYDWKISILGSSGYRNPNIDDISKINDSKGSDNLLIIPNPDLKSEKVYNGEISISKIFEKNIQFEFTGFYSKYYDVIVQRPTLFNGEDSILYDGSLCQVQTNINKNEAYIYGWQGNILAKLNENVSIYSNYTYTYGQVESDDVPLDHIPPAFGKTGIKYERKKLKSEFSVIYNGWKKLFRYSPSGEDNLTYATSVGMPSWHTLNLKISYQLSKNISIQGGVDNITDLHYRYFASGISAAGRNYILALKANF
ncbi:MAG: hypothetical protein A2X12_06110 [Bacteroidetes bacterium GWE2_29_8]|nr:MAG: hypothetical protein A2X12_06110 [Bacteroidetes bacterium GWE2_29_8]OFY24391.1 MAG: hypothetical protein A2X02_08215 [Bacteroidetes bacterium GWF2_29_10]